MIGINILNKPDAFSAALKAGDDICVHTWTHPYMSTLSLLDIFSQVSFVPPVLSQGTQLKS